MQAQHLALRVGDEMLEAFVGEHLVRAYHLEGAVKKLEWARLTLQVLVQDVLHVQVARRLQTPCGMVHIGDVVHVPELDEVGGIEAFMEAVLMNGSSVLGTGQHAQPC